MQHISLLLSVVRSAFVSDCPPLPSLLNLGQITVVQLNYVTDSASHISVQKLFGSFPWNILFAFRGRTQLIQWNYINVKVYSPAFALTFHSMWNMKLKFSEVLWHCKL